MLCQIYTKKYPKYLLKKKKKREAEKGKKKWDVFLPEDEETSDDESLRVRVFT